MRPVSIQEVLAMRAAYAAASVSPDRSTQNGAVMIECGQTISACNRFPRGVDPGDDAVHEKTLKNKLIVHAERRVIYKAAHLGIGLLGSTMVACWAACSTCAQAIVEAGIKRLVVHGDRMDETPDRWKEDVGLGLSILTRGGVEIVRIDGPVDAGVEILFDGRRITV